MRLILAFHFKNREVYTKISDTPRIIINVSSYEERELQRN